MAKLNRDIQNMKIVNQNIERKLNDVLKIQSL